MLKALPLLCARPHPSSYLAFQVIFCTEIGIDERDKYVCVLSPLSIVLDVWHFSHRGHPLGEQEVQVLIERFRQNRGRRRWKTYRI